MPYGLTGLRSMDGKRKKEEYSVRNCSFQYTLACKIDDLRDSFVFSEENAHGLRRS